MKDIRGVEITPGAIVVYPGRQSSSLWLNVATVVEVHDGDPAKAKTYPYQTGAKLVVDVHGSGENKRRSTITVLNRIAVVVQA